MIFEEFDDELAKYGALSLISGKQKPPGYRLFGCPEVKRAALSLN